MRCSIKEFHKKRGSLNLSINAIVILILAITMLGLGLGFMKKMFGQTTEQFSAVSEDIKEQKMKEARDSGERVYWPLSDITAKPNDQKTFYFGITNVEDSLYFYSELSCPDTDFTPFTAGTSTDDVKFPGLIQKTPKIQSSDVYVGKVVVKIKSGATKGTHACFIRVCKGTTAPTSCAETDEDNPDTFYGRKDFFVTVE